MVLDVAVVLPDDFDEYEWELESKGWFEQTVMICNSSNYRLGFHDPVRFAQYVKAELLSDEFF